MKKSISILTSLLLFIPLLFAQQAEELGKVNWLRDYHNAVELAQKEQKDILILFQEVPGCATCRNYGHDVLSEPLMVEAIEQYFVPLAVYNNLEGEDAKILKKYGEPSWNNPVIRIVDVQGNDVVERLASDYSLYGLYDRMQSVFELRKIKTDPYFGLLGEEIKADQFGSRDTSFYSMHCFWEGELDLGSADGVIATEPAFMDGKEVVKVEFDNNRIKKTDLDQYAIDQEFDLIEFDDSYRIDKDPQYYLKQSAYSKLPLSRIQRSKINTALENGEDASLMLSPRQKDWLNEINRGKVLAGSIYTLPIQIAWEKLE